MGRRSHCHRLSGYARGRSRGPWATPAAHRSTQPEDSKLCKGLQPLKSPEELAWRAVQRPKLAPMPATSFRCQWRRRLACYTYSFRHSLGLQMQPRVPPPSNMFPEHFCPAQCPGSRPELNQRFCPFVCRRLTLVHHQASHVCYGKRRHWFKAHAPWSYHIARHRIQRKVACDSPLAGFRVHMPVSATWSSCQTHGESQLQ